MTLLGDAYVRIRPDGQNFGRESSSIVGKAGRKAATAFAAGFAAIGVAGLLKGAITEASDLGESINAVNISFGKAAKGVLALGEDAAKAVGLSNVEFNALAVRFSSFAKTIAGDGGDVTKTLKDLTTRAADFASVMNLEVADATAIFQSGLAGEAEPLRAYGIDLSAAAVAAYAMSEGISTSAATMTEAEKIQARYGLIMEKTAATTGDFANTSDGLANSQRILGASWDNLKAKAGESLVPALAGVTSFVADKMLPAIEDAGPKIAGMFDGLDLGPKVKDAFKTASDALQNLITTGAEWDFGRLIIDRVGEGLSTGNWGPLGTAIKDGLGRIDAMEVGLGLGDLLKSALKNLGDIAGDVYTFVKDMIHKVDWADLAFEFGKQAPTLIIGFATGLLNFDIGSLLGFLGDHWLEVLIGILTVAFAPLKIITAVAKILGRIPLVGPFLKWGLTAFKTFSDRVVGFLGQMIGRFARGLFNGSPRIVGAFGRILQNVWTHLYVWGDDAIKWFRDLPGTLGQALGRGAEALGRSFRTLLATLKTPLRAMLTFINTHLIGNLEKVTSKFGLTLPRIPIAFASGGIVPGGYSPGRDTTIAAVGAGEAVMRPEWTRAMGADYVHRMNSVARQGGVQAVRRHVANGGPAFALGGIVDGMRTAGSAVKDGISWAKNSVENLLAKGLGYALDKIVSPIAGQVGKMPPPFLGDFMGGLVGKLTESIKSWGESESTASGSFSGGVTIPPGQGSARLIALGRMLQSKGFRVGEHPSFGGVAPVHKGRGHYEGRAIDVNYGPGGRSEIETRAINGVINAIRAAGFRTIWQAPGHYGHAHVEYDQGGLIQPGLTSVYNRSGKPEAVLTNTEMQMFKALVSQGGATSIVGGDLVIQSTGNTRDDLAEAMFQLRRAKRGGSPYA